MPLHTHTRHTPTTPQTLGQALGLKIKSHLKAGGILMPD
jgi:hypothetical protein